MSGRKLTKGEIELARSIFKDHIDYDRVRIYQGQKWMFFMPSDRVHAPDGHIYYPMGTLKDYYDDIARDGTIQAQAKFIHEMTHVWQAQSGVQLATMVPAEYLISQLRGTDPYVYDPTERKSFSDLTYEAQAQVMRDTFYGQKGYRRNTLMPGLVPDMRDPNISTKTFGYPNVSPGPRELDSSP